MHPGRVSGGQPQSPVLDDDVEARYGRARPTGPRRLRRVLAGVGAVAALALFLWFAVEITDRDVRWQTVLFVVTDDEHVDVTFEVYGDEGARVRCVVHAASDDFADAGQVQVDLGPLPPGGAVRETVTVRSIVPPANASVRTCAVLPDGLS